MPKFSCLIIMPISHDANIDWTDFILFWYAREPDTFLFHHCLAPSYVLIKCTLFLFLIPHCLKEGRSKILMTTFFDFRILPRKWGKLNYRCLAWLPGICLVVYSHFLSSILWLKGVLSPLFHSDGGTKLYLSDCSPNGSNAKSPVYCSIFGRNKRRLITGLYCTAELLS